MIFKRRSRQTKEPEPGTFYGGDEADVITLEALQRLRQMREIKPEVTGDHDDEFVLKLRDIKEKLSIPNGSKVVYPGSNTHVGVARVFGKENVIHIDPDAAVCEVLTIAGYDAQALGIEDFMPASPLDVMVALNSYGAPTAEIIERTIKPGGLVIANNYTGWASELNGLDNLRLTAAILPAYNSPDATLVLKEAIPEGVTDVRTSYYKVEPGGKMHPGTPEDHTFANVSSIYPDALFVFEHV